MTVLRWWPARLVLAAVLALTAALLAAGGTAHAQADVAEIADELREDHVYVDPAASDELTTREAAAVADRIRDAGVPVYVAVLPDDPSYGGEQVFDRLRAAVGRPGVYAVALGSDFGAASDASVLPGSTAQALAAQNVSEHSGDPPAILDGFVADVAAATAAGNDGQGGSQGSGTGAALVMLAMLALFLGGAVFLVRRAGRRRRRAERAGLEQVRGAVEEDITAYGEELTRLGFGPADPDATPESVQDYGRALDAYETAKARSAAARRPEDMRAVTEALEDGRFALACLDARREGRPLPEHRPPCFFDPRHGPSVDDAEWAPEGGTPREVPVCAADATRIADGLDPAIRTVPVGAERRPYWDAGPAYGPWAGGYFGAYGSMLLPGLLVGTMLGGAMQPGYGIDFGGGFDGGAGDGGAGGDFGGGFDGGGFGGGGFGGGDGGGF